MSPLGNGGTSWIDGIFGESRLNTMNQRSAGPSLWSAASPWAQSTPLGEAIPAKSGIDLAGYWRLVLKHKIIIGLILVTALVLGVVVTLLMTPIYTSSSTLQIDREAARVLNVDDAQPREAMIQGEEFFQTQYGLLRSRSLAERVSESLGLTRSNAFLETMGVEPPSSTLPAEALRTERRERVLKALEDNLSVSPVRGSRLVIVSFSSPDRNLSARVTTSFAENFIQSNLDRKFQSSVYARRFLEDRIEQTRARLEDAERQLVTYAVQQQIINVNDSRAPGENQSLAASDLVAINAALSEATAKRVTAEANWRQARTATNSALNGVLNNPTAQRLSEESARLKAQYEQKLTIYKPDFPEMEQLSAQIREIDLQISGIGVGVKNSIRNEYEAAVREEVALRRRVDALKVDVLDLRDRSIQYNILQRELDTSRTLYDGLLQRYKEVGVTGGITTNNVSIVDNAEPAQEPSSPRLLLNMAIATLLGLGLGFVTVFVMEALDESIANPDDVESKLHIPVLGTVPKLDKNMSPATALADSRSPFAEAYQSLRTALAFSTPDGPPRSLLVTSSRPGEGKSTTAKAIAQTMAGVGKKVLLVDGDLRNPSMHRSMGVDNDRGMSNLLSGSITLEDIVFNTDIPNLSFIPCGPLPPNPAELWGSDRVRRFIDDALTRYDHVIIDGPPVLGFADAPLIAASVTGVAFVVESQGTRRGQARGAMRRLQMGSVHILGVVLTKFNTKAASYGSYDYSYDYHYGPQTDEAGVRK